jgi:hypothetical protein
MLSVIYEIVYTGPLQRGFNILSSPLAISIPQIPPYTLIILSLMLYNLHNDSVVKQPTLLGYDLFVFSSTVFDSNRIIRPALLAPRVADVVWAESRTGTSSIGRTKRSKVIQVSLLHGFTLSESLGNGEKYAHRTTAPVNALP